MDTNRKTTNTLFNTFINKAFIKRYENGLRMPDSVQLVAKSTKKKGL